MRELSAVPFAFIPNYGEGGVDIDQHDDARLVWLSSVTPGIGSRERLLRWSPDEGTALAATEYPLPIARNTPAEQFKGSGTNAKTWNDRVFQPAEWGVGDLDSSPEKIIRLFRNKQYTQGFAMVCFLGRDGTSLKGLLWAQRQSRQ